MTIQRLRSSGDVRAVFSARAAAACPHAVVHVRRRGDGAPPRVTVVAGKKVGNAVARNRAKRRLRALTRTIPLSNGADYVIVARPAALKATPQDLQRHVGRVFQKLEGNVR